MARSCHCPSHNFRWGKLLTDPSPLICSICRQRKPGLVVVQFQCGKLVCTPCQWTHDKLYTLIVGPRETDNKQTQAK